MSTTYNKSFTFRKVVLGYFLFVLLAFVFAVLKLSGVIGWSWWWVLCPVYAPVIITKLFAVGYLVYYLASPPKKRALLNKWEERLQDQHLNSRHQQD